MGEKKTLVLIDGHALAFRQYYALEQTNMRTKDGIPTWAVFGFFKAIFDLLKNKNFKPDAIAVAFDVSHHTFRTEEYDQYKANRSAMPDDMQIQMQYLYEGLKAFSIPVYTKEGFEADDVIGTISKKACELGHNVCILTGDQDSFQLIRENGCVKVIIPSKGELKEYDWEKVYEKLGVYPNQVIDYKALRGDTSDNIPGVKGIGEKTAIKLLNEFKTVDNVLNNIDKVDGKSIREKLTQGLEDAKMSKYLATIVQDVDIEFDFEKTKVEMPNITQVTDFLRKMQFYSYLKNIESILKLFLNDQNIVENSIPKQQVELALINEDSSNGQLGLFTQAIQSQINKEELAYHTKIITDSVDFEDMMQTLSNKKIIAVNSFVDMYNAVNYDLFGVALAYNDSFDYVDGKVYAPSEIGTTEVFYIPFKHFSEKNADVNYVMPMLKSLMENSEVKKIVHDLKVQNCVFKTLLQGIVQDTMLACYIKYSNVNNAFDIQCMEQIDHILPTVITTTKKKSFAENSLETMKDYSADVMSSMFKLGHYWSEKLDEHEYKILNDIEIPLAGVLYKMETAGVCVDEKYLKELTSDFNEKVRLIERKIYDLAGEGFNINSPKQVAHILFEKLGISNGRKRGKSKNSTSAEILNELAQEHEIVRLILEYRKYSKLISTYTDALPALIDKHDRRIHTTFNQSVTITGRLSSSNPNLQNIPVRTEEGTKIRQAFVPADRQNSVILSADYSQIELRLLAHVSGDKHLIEAFNSGVDIHTLTASKVFDVPVDEVTKQMRYQSKAVNFGIVYGQSKYGLAKVLKVTSDEADNFIKKYFKTYPSVHKYMDKMVNLLEKQGYVETIFGRKRYLENEINSSNAMIREFAKRAAINHPMQGTASDLIKIAMVDFDKKLEENNLKSKLIMQVHDELIVEVLEEELEIVKQMLVESMTLNQPLKVPLIVDIGVGKSWQD